MGGWKNRGLEDLYLVSRVFSLGLLVAGWVLIGVYGAAYLERVGAALWQSRLVLFLSPVVGLVWALREGAQLVHRLKARRGR